MVCNSRLKIDVDDRKIEEPAHVLDNTAGGFEAAPGEGCFRRFVGGENTMEEFEVWLIEEVSIAEIATMVPWSVCSSQSHCFVHHVLNCQPIQVPGTGQGLRPSSHPVVIMPQGTITASNGMSTYPETLSEQEVNRLWSLVDLEEGWVP